VQRLKELAKARQDLDREEKAIRVQIQKEMLKQQESLEGLGIHAGKVPLLDKPPVTEIKLLETILDRLDKLEKRIERAEKAPAAQLTSPPPGLYDSTPADPTPPKRTTPKR
jgi:hypothetical protein